MNDLYSEVRASRLPVLLYGMGDGADKLLKVLEAKGIPVSGVFCSNGFERGKSFHGMPVVSYADAVKEYSRFFVLLAFGTSRADVIENIKRISEEQPLRVPDLPVAGNALFDADFYKKNLSLFMEARALFEDERSENLFDALIRAKLFGRLDDLLCCTSDPEEDFPSLLCPSSYRRIADLGAYDGDSARRLMTLCPECERITAFEPDRRTYERLVRKTSDLPVTPLPFAAWDRDETIFFRRAGNRGSGAGENGTSEVRAIRCDGAFSSERVDLIKFDVEGAEKRALEGLCDTIARDLPDMIVSCYHRPEDLFDLPLYIRERYPAYKLYLRRKRCLPAWETVLYCVLPDRKKRDPENMNKEGKLQPFFEDRSRL